MKLRHAFCSAITLAIRSTMIAMLTTMVPMATPTYADETAVSNIEVTVPDVSLNVVGFAVAQSFTTGNDGTTLASVTVDAGSILGGGSSGMLLRADNNGVPGALIEDLGSQPARATTYNSIGTNLLANSTYWVTLGESNSGFGDYFWAATASPDETSSLGWTIGDEALSSSDGGASWAPFTIGPAKCRCSVQIEPIPLAPITFSYTGTVDGMASGGFPDAAPFQAFGAQPIEVTFTFDPNTADNNPSANGDYLDAVTDLEVTVGGNVYTDIDGGDIIITNNNVNPDQFQVFSFVTGPAVGGISEDIQFRMIFSDSTNTVISTDALPSNQPNPDAFDLGGQINLQFTDVNNFDNFGNIITNEVECSPGCPTFGRNILITRRHTDPSIFFGPVSFGLGQLPAELDYTVLVGPGTPTGGGVTEYGLDDVIFSNLNLGDGVFNDLLTFELAIMADSTVEKTMDIVLGLVDTVSVSEASIVLSSTDLFITGTDIAGDQNFAYMYGESTDTVEMNAMLGDANQDETVNLLDVAPFIDLLSSGEFQLHADINEDGAVNLLDVQPFIAILSGG